MPQSELLDFYRSAEPLTDPRPHRELLDSLPRDLEALCAAIQGLVLHVHWAQRYGVTPSEQQLHDVQARSLGAILARILERDDRPLCEPRPMSARFTGNCRDFTVLLCAALRHQGVPARARCGFGAYFSPGNFEDHWVAEHWSSERGRWIRSDAQLDALQRQALALAFDPLDIPAEEFLVAGRAWELCARGDADPARFGIFDMRGLWFIRGNLLRDLAALNRMELLPWDCWGLMLQLGQADDCAPNALALLERASALSQAGDESFDAMRKLYASEPSLRVPTTVTNFQTGKQERLTPS